MTGVQLGETSMPLSTYTSAAFTEQHSKRTQEYEHTKEGSADDRRRIYSKKPRINGSSVQTAGKTPEVTA
jgi:hypothetical protein